MDSCKVISLKNSFHKVYKVFFILLPQVIVCKLIMSVFKDFEFDIVFDVSYKHKVDSLTLLLLSFVDLLAYICYIV